MKLQKINNYKMTKGFDRILSLENKDAYLAIIEKLTKTKIIAKDNKVLIVF